MEGSVLDEMVEECDYKKNMEEYEQPICVFLLDWADALLCGNIQWAWMEWFLNANQIKKCSKWIQK